MISDTQIEKNKQQILRLLRSTGREGVERVIRYLNKNGFFYVPSSIDRHHNWKGGLAQHSLGVYIKASARNHDQPDDSLIIAAILHDICKTRKLYYDSRGHLQHHRTHIKGHGSRSIWILNDLDFHLTNDEHLAIRWHMHGRRTEREDEPELKEARTSSLWKMICYADNKDASQGWRRNYKRL